MMVAMGVDYTLAYLTPVLALPFLAPGARAPTIAGSTRFLLSVAIACLSGILFSRFFLEFPLVFLPLLTLILFHLYYTTSLQSTKVWMFLSLMLIPMMSLQSARLGDMVAVNLFVNALLAIVLVRVVYFLFPGDDSIAGNKQAVVTQSDAEQRFIAALHKTLVVIPVLILFFVFNLSDSLLVLIFVAIFSMNPAAANKKTAIAMILANLGGGLAAIVAFNLLTAATSYVFFGMLTLLAGLLFAYGVFSSKPAAPLFGMAFSTFLLILGNVISIAGEAGEMVWVRILQIGMAMIYMVIAFGVVDRLTVYGRKPVGT
jgi:hypothetical protein